MKKKLLVLTILTILVSSITFGQTATLGKYYYAEVTVHLGGFNKYKSTTIDFGTEYGTQVEKKDEIAGKVNSFKNGVDIKNYLSDKGWEYMDVQNMLFADMVVVYTFRKSKQ